MKAYRIFNQFRSNQPRGWSFVPFSVWRSEDFCGVVILNLCFEWPLSKTAETIHAQISRG